MWIGVGRIILDFYNNDDAKKKHHEIENLCKDMRKKFNISMLEISDFDDPEKCAIGFAAVLPDHWKKPAVQTFLDKIRETIDSEAFARVTVEDCDILSH